MRNAAGSLPAAFFKEREKSMQKSIKKYFPIFALPTLVAFTIGFLVPFIMGIYLSFCKFTTVTDAKFVGISNYLKIFTDKTFNHALWYTALFTIVSVIMNKSTADFENKLEAFLPYAEVTSGYIEESSDGYTLLIYTDKEGKEYVKSLI